MYGVTFDGKNFTPVAMDDTGNIVNWSGGIEPALAYRKYMKMPAFADAIALITRTQPMACCPSCAMTPISEEMMHRIAAGIRAVGSVDTAFAIVQTRQYPKNSGTGAFIVTVLKQ